MFSTRVPAMLQPNRLAAALAERRAAGASIIDLTESNPTRVGLTYPGDLLQALADPGGRNYDPQPFGLETARAAVAADFGRRSLQVPPDNIVLTASTSEAYSLLFKLLCDPGDEVLVPAPSYPLFDHLSRLDAVVVVPYRLEYHGTWRLDRADLERGLSVRTRAVLCVQPNNPTGSMIDADELAWLSQWCAGHDLAIVGDEVFADYPIEPAPAASRSVLDAASAGGLVFSLGGLSKSAGLPQVKLGWIALAGAPHAVRAAAARLEFICDTYLSVSTPVQRAAPALIAGGAGMRQQIRDRVLANYQALRRTAAAHQSGSVLRAEGGWSAVVQVPATEPEETIVLQLLERAGVLVHPGYFFDFAHEAFLIVSLLVAPAEFLEGIGKLFETVDR